MWIGTHQLYLRKREESDSQSDEKARDTLTLSSLVRRSSFLFSPLNLELEDLGFRLIQGHPPQLRLKMDDVFEEESEQTVTIHEYLEDVEERELEADLVLGGDEGKECTYEKGYMKRQAIFSCLTCTPDGNAGICTACSLSCHDGHEVLELWTKRNFKCDCGNSKFGAFFCKLFANKDPENTGNSYNNNFKGSYCTCGRPYPDPDTEEQVEMIQCCICEDWFHEDHLGLKSPDEIPRDDKDEPLYEDFICQACVVICSFLTLYPQAIWAPSRQSDARPSTGKEVTLLADAPSACSSSVKLDSGVCSSELSKSDPSLVNIDIEKTPGEKGGSLKELSEKNMDLEGNASVDALSICSSGKLESGSSSHSLGKDSSLPHHEFENEASKEGVSLAETPMKTMGLEQGSQNPDVSSKCVLGVDLQVTPLVLEKEKPFFLSKNWRDLLCRCDTCIKFYTHKGVGFLIDTGDSIIEYEKVAKLKREEKLQQQEGVELNFLNGMGHVAKIEMLNGIADMQNELRSFLESSDPSKPITSADVHQSGYVDHPDAEDPRNNQLVKGIMESGTNRFALFVPPPCEELQWTSSPSSELHHVDVGSPTHPPWIVLYVWERNWSPDSRFGWGEPEHGIGHLCITIVPTV
ncbi:hypothetical protein NE237_013350 [Protea cynaroides]|uniref:UBR-type domain-containing protein n=1 Tax=Protea cynaroides TaxID=273540 RepID=A0A9Q0JYW9_9MAGN|nr:hypothetical protein NE237_013350 [Protea cynaroides]